MDNSGTKPKINESIVKNITKGDSFFIDHKWSTARISCLDSKSTKKEKAYALNHFLNKNFLDKTEKELINYRCSTKIDSIYKYRVFYSDQNENRYASYSSIHSVLASLVLDLPSVENEHPVVTSLKENFNKIKCFVEDKSRDNLEFSRSSDALNRFYKSMVKHIIISDESLSKVLDIDSLREIPKNATYTIDKK